MRLWVCVSVSKIKHYKNIACDQYKKITFEVKGSKSAMRSTENYNSYGMHIGEFMSNCSEVELEQFIKNGTLQEKRYARIERSCRKINNDELPLN